MFQVVTQFEVTPKVLANFSPGFERSENPGIGFRVDKTLKWFANRQTLSEFNMISCAIPRVVADAPTLG